MIGERLWYLLQLHVAGREGGLVRGEDKVEKGQHGYAEAVCEAVDCSHQDLGVVGEKLDQSADSGRQGLRRLALLFRGSIVGQ